MIDVSDLLEKENKESLNIIDIRESYQYNSGHINNAKNIPMNYLLINPEYYLNKNKIYYIYCQYGSSSKTVTNKLNSLGYKVININGGYNAYKMTKSN